MWDPSFVWVLSVHPLRNRRQIWSGLRRVVSLYDVLPAPVPEHLSTPQVCSTFGNPTPFLPWVVTGEVVVRQCHSPRCVLVASTPLESGPFIPYNSPGTRRLRVKSWSLGLLSLGSRPLSRVLTALTPFKESVLRSTFDVTCDLSGDTTTRNTHVDYTLS